MWSNWKSVNLSVEDCKEVELSQSGTVNASSSRTFTFNFSNHFEELIGIKQVSGNGEYGGIRNVSIDRVNKTITVQHTNMSSASNTAKITVVAFGY